MSLAVTAPASVAAPRPRSAASEPAPSCTPSSPLSSSGTDLLDFPNGLTSPAWVSDDLRGGHRRTFDGCTVTAVLDVEAGGFDTAVTRYLPPDEVRRVSRVPSGTSVSATWSTDAGTAAHWWAGPKINVNGTPGWSETGWHENYVVEDSSRTPQEVGLVDGGATFLGSRRLSGSVYRFYRNRHATWDQYRAVRQEFRSSGSVDVAAVLSAWRSQGMPDGYVTGYRANLETDGPVRGTFTISDVTLLCGRAAARSRRRDGNRPAAPGGRVARAARTRPRTPRRRPERCRNGAAHGTRAPTIRGVPPHHRRGVPGGVGPPPTRADATRAVRYRAPLPAPALRGGRRVPARRRAERRDGTASRYRPAAYRK